MKVYTPQHEEITGADLSGTSGAKNRTYELANNNAIAAQMQISRAEAFLPLGLGFTFDAPTNTVTFKTKVWNDDNISLDYQVGDS